MATSNTMNDLQRAYCLYMLGLTESTLSTQDLLAKVYAGLITGPAGTSGVVSVNGTSGVVVIDKTTVGLANVDNTSDVNKPVSTATTTQLNLKAPLASPAFTGTPTGITATHVGLGSVNNTSDAAKPVSTATQTQLDLKAPLASPAFTGTPTGITKTHVGLGNVDNTSDVNKPVSTAQQTALNLKQDTATIVELIQDTVAGMFTTGSYTGLATPVYDDADGSIDLTVTNTGIPPTRFAASVPDISVTGSDRAYQARTIIECHLRVSAAPTGAALTCVVQTSPDGTTWTNRQTMTIADGASTLTHDVTGLSIAQSVGDWLRVNCTSVGTTTPAQDPVLDVVFA